MYSQRDEKVFWVQWLGRYKSLKCLWDEDCKRQKGRKACDAAYAELAEYAKIINPDADIEFVRNRINSFRASCRREFRKVKAARQNDITYTPQLFYYDALKFLYDDLEKDDSLYDEPESNSYSIDDESTDPIDSSDQTKLTTEDIIHKLKTKKEALRKSLNKNNDNSEKTVNEEQKKFTKKRKCSSFEEAIDDEDSENCPQIQLTQLNDEYAILSYRIAAHFRNMNKDQRLFAEKIISDVCIYARMEKLTLRSNLVLDSENKKNSNCMSSETPDYDNPDTYIHTS